MKEGFRNNWIHFCFETPLPFISVNFSKDITFRACAAIQVKENACNPILLTLLLQRYYFAADCQVDLLPWFDVVERDLRPPFRPSLQLGQTQVKRRRSYHVVHREGRPHRLDADDLHARQ